MAKGIDVLEKRGVANPAILDAMRKVPREKFYSNDGRVDSAHSSRLDGVTITPPEVIAQMIEALNLQPGDNILQVGTGTGYTAAVLSRMVTSVFTVERDEEMAQAAQATLAEAGFKNVQVLYGSTLKQYAANAPYDGILVSASMMTVPQRLAKRLAVGGKLVAPLGRGRDQRLVRVVRKDERIFDEKVISNLKVMPLLGDILVEMGVVDRDEVEMAALEADVRGSRLGDVLLDGHYVEESDIYTALARQQSRKTYTAREVLDGIDPKVHQSIPRAFMIHNRLVVMNKRNGLLHVATTDVNLDDDELAQSLGLQSVDIGLITPTDFELVWSSLDGTVSDATVKAATEEKEADGKEEKTVRFDAQTIAFFEQLLVDATEARASDVHFERHEQDVRVRFRIDGKLRNQDSYSLDPKTLAGVVHLVKVSARMDPSIRRQPQSGHFQRRINDQAVDLRAHTQPALFGETVVIRILSPEMRIQEIEDLGFTTEMAGDYRDLLENRSGLILLVGPTGSGRSTTLYAGMRRIARDDTRKVVSVEDPISYALPGVTQLRIDPDNDFEMSHAIQTAVRGDANVIMVGDISDDATAQQTVRASLAGHLALGSLFGRQSEDAIQGLYELGVSPRTIASELLGIVAQILVPRICPECREEVEPEAELLEEIFPQGAPEDLTVYRGKGCDHCDDHGTHGRVPVTEFMKVDSNLRNRIAERASVEELRSAAREAGLVSMRATAIPYVQSGTIQLEELRWIPEN